ncbi:hypothetical protein U1Q18_046652 [Sarracenia purpurea var. burkii]
MSTVFCQGPQSYLESQLVETRTLRLKLAPSPCFFESAGVPSCPTVPESPSKNLIDKSHCEEINPNPSNSGLGSWNFFQNLYNSPHNHPKEEFKTEISYVHPKVSRSSSIFSHKSLELCTENLGCETGTDMAETGCFSLSPPPSNGGETPARERRKSSHRTDQPRRVNDCRDFPPPLTTISGSSCLRVRRHHENGRLIIDAVETPPTNTYLQAERSHGRLTLSLWKDCCPTTFDSEMATEENEESDVEEIDNERNGEERQGGEEKEERESGDQESGEESDENEREDMEGNCSDVEEYLQPKFLPPLQKFRRPSSCKVGEAMEVYIIERPFGWLLEIGGCLVQVP